MFAYVVLGVLVGLIVAMLVMRFVSGLRHPDRPVRVSDYRDRSDFERPRDEGDLL